MNDPEFLSMSPQDKAAVLARIDSEFAAMADPDKQAVVARLSGLAPPTPIPQQGGGFVDAAKRFGTSFAQSMNPMPLVRGAITGPVGKMMQGDFRGAGNQFGETAMNLAEGVSSIPSPRRAQAAYEHLRGGRPLDAALSVGSPITEGVVNQARSGDVAGAAGTTAGLVFGPKIVEGGLNLASKVAPALTRGAQANAMNAANATPRGRTVQVRTGKGTPFADPEGMTTLRGRQHGELHTIETPSGGQAKVRVFPEQKSPGKIIAEGVGKAAVGEAVGTSIGLPGAAGSVAAWQTIGKLMKTPQWNTISAMLKSRAAELLAAGQGAEAAALLTRAVQLGSASQDPRQKYIDNLIGGGI
jgi:hypothetical protein